MSEAKKPSGRAGQRRRTRKAIIQAAMALLAREKSPSIADIAAEADVSRRTVYMYFPTLEHLLADAALGLVAEATGHGPGGGSTPSDNVEVRVDRMVRAVQRMSSDTEKLGRTVIRLTLESRAGAAGPRRGYRRVEWTESALEPLRGRVTRQAFERLVSAISMVIGWEALLVQRDIRGLDPADAEDVSAWAARALVRATLAEQEPAEARHRSGRARRSGSGRPPRRRR
jgi:AcrR family transcriptional regulator